MPDEPKPKSRSFASAAKMGAKLARLAAKLKAETAARMALEKEAAELKAKPLPEDVVKERDQLKAEKRADKHRKAFENAAKKAKVKPEALEDLWQLAKLDTSADEPDAKAIETAVSESVKTRSYLVDSGTAQKPALQPGPGSDRGERSNNGGFVVTKSQLSDPLWMSQHQSEYADACKSGTVHFER